MDVVDANEKENEIIALNVGGTIFQCYRKILHSFPESKLANMDLNANHITGRTEHFFDRNPLLFAYILDGYRSGILHLPKDVCGTKLKEELCYWDLSPEHVPPCCLDALYKGEDEVVIMETLTESLHQSKGFNSSHKGKFGFRQKLWLFLDEPRSSKSAMVWCVAISILIVASALMEALATLPFFQVKDNSEEISHLRHLAELDGWDNSSTDILVSHKSHPIIQYADFTCHLILTLEFIIGALVCHNRLQFWKSPLRIIVLIGYVAYWIDVCLEFNFYRLTSVHLFRLYLGLRYLTIFMLARLLYIAKNIPAFNLIGLTFRSSKQELTILGFVLMILVSVFGFIMFVSERFNNENIQNVFTAMYWALISLTTVGYGYYTPTTVSGHVVAGTCAVCGVIVLALPIGIMASTFYTFYNYHRYARKHAQVFEKQSLNSPQSTFQKKNDNMTENNGRKTESTSETKHRLNGHSSLSTKF